MKPLTGDQIRACLVNATQGEAKRLNTPILDDVPWEDLDMLGWRDPSASRVGAMALWRGGGAGEDAGTQAPVAILLRATERPASTKQGMCSLCHTFHSASDVAFFSAKRAGSRGRDHNTVGAAMCADLSCSLYARRLRKPRRVQPQETISIEARVARLQENLDRFVARVVDGL